MHYLCIMTGGVIVIRLRLMNYLFTMIGRVIIIPFDAFSLYGTIAFDILSLYDNIAFHTLSIYFFHTRYLAP